ncbi:MAG TPA: hypothetical protein VK858_17895 [Longimicrobiales bacterium]|nr:hypothetical protein [Longimicrobiales bacterium]
MNTNQLVGLTVLLLSIPAVGHGQEPGAALVGEGGQVFVSHCTRCHNARAGSERSDAHWVPITLHMRARANLTARQARAVLAFLQATNQDSRAAAALSSLTVAPADSQPGVPVVFPAGSRWWQVAEQVQLPFRRVPGARSVFHR